MLNAIQTAMIKQIHFSLHFFIFFFVESCAVIDTHGSLVFRKKEGIDNQHMAAYCNEDTHITTCTDGMTGQKIDLSK